jgi:hypothetical protein
MLLWLVPPPVADPTGNYFCLSNGDWGLVGPFNLCVHHSCQRIQTFWPCVREYHKGIALGLGNWVISQKCWAHKWHQIQRKLIPFPNPYKTCFIQVSMWKRAVMPFSSSDTLFSSLQICESFPSFVATGGVCGLLAIRSNSSKFRHLLPWGAR